MPETETGAVPPRRPDTLHRLERLYADAVGIVERDHAATLEIDAIARELTTSRRQLQRAFAVVGATTFRTHVTHVRMAAAARLLADPSLPIGTVARRVGYRSAAHFTTSFREHHGSLPSDYRRRLALARLERERYEQAPAAARGGR